MTGIGSVDGPGTWPHRLGRLAPPHVRRLARPLRLACGLHTLLRLRRGGEMGDQQRREQKGGGGGGGGGGPHGERRGEGLIASGPVWRG